MIAQSRRTCFDVPVLPTGHEAVEEQLELINSVTRLDAIWPAIKPLLDKALNTSHGELNATDVKIMCIAQTAQFAVRWKNGKPTMVVVWEYLRYPRFTVANIIALAGRDVLSFMANYWAFITGVMKQQGATRVDCLTYNKLADLMEARYGFETAYRHMRKKL